MADKNPQKPVQNHPPSQNQNPQQSQNPPSNQNPQTGTDKKDSQQWTFGYPQCINKKESRLVCLAKECDKYPFFCSACEDESCQHQHQHKDRITSIGFKELIRKLITQRKPPENLEKAVKQYKQKLQQMLESVKIFVQKQQASMDELLKNSFVIDGEQAFVVQKLKEKRYQQIKGKQLDRVWNKVVPNEHKKKMQNEMIEFIDSKRVEVEEMTNNFKEGAKTENQSPKKANNQANQPQKPGSQNSQVPPSNTTNTVKK